MYGNDVRGASRRAGDADPVRVASFRTILITLEEFGQPP